MPQHRHAAPSTSHAHTRPAAMTDSKHTTGPTLRWGETQLTTAPRRCGVASLAVHHCAAQPCRVRPTIPPEPRHLYTHHTARQHAPPRQHRAAEEFYQSLVRPDVIVVETPR
eukprot:scaffold14130_cov51-Phaeocystis_antarctica.AAC.1